METILSSILLSVSTNLDNFTIGIVYSLKKSQIDFAANLAIALLSGISTFVAMLVGNSLQHWLIPNVTNEIGSLVLILIGCVNLGHILQKKFALRRETEIFSLDLAREKLISGDRAINLKEAIFLGLALTITNLGTGIGAGMAHLDIFLTSGFSFISSLITIGLGTFIGKTIILIFSTNRLQFIASLLLIILGVYEYITV